MKYWEGLMRYDKRVVDRLIQKGIVTQKEYEEYLKKLPDLKDKVEVVKIEVTNQEGADDRQ